MKDLYITIYGGGEDAVEAAKKLSTAGEWIPVGERMPEPGVRVLIFCPLAEPNEVATACLRHEGLWRTDDGEVFGESEPTHWMPLPEPPEVA